MGPYNTVTGNHYIYNHGPTQYLYILIAET